MTLDLPTIALVAVLIGCLLSVGALFIGWTLRGQAGLRHWMVGSVCLSSAGLWWAVLQGLVPEAALGLVFYGLLYLGMALWWGGAMRFSFRPLASWKMWVGLPPYLVWIFWFTVMAPHSEMRVLAFIVTTALWSFATAWVFFRHSPPGLRGSTLLAGALSLLHGVFNVARIFFPLDSSSLHDLMEPGWPHVSVALEAIVLSTATTLSLVVVLHHRLSRELQIAARIDPLTQVLNRRAIEEEAKKALRRCGRAKAPCSLLLFDLDFFREINNRHGHQAGDAALRHFTTIASRAVRPVDRFGRFGGEEFLLILPGANAAAAAAVAERIRSAVASHPVEHETGILELTVSVGVSSTDAVPASLDNMLSRADGALYEAKTGGRDRVFEAPPLTAAGAR